MTRAERVISVYQAEMAKPYAYGGADGTSDCFFAGLALVDAVTGTDHVAAYRGSYRTLKGAQRALRKRGHTTLTTFFADAIGLEAVPAGMARMGDIAVVERDGAEHVAICTGNGFMAKTEAGPVSFEIGAVEAAFRV